MPRCEVLSALKWMGTRFTPGAALDLTDEEIASLPEGTVRVQMETPTAPAPAKPSRSAEEKASALREAQGRVAQSTGSGVPPEHSDSVESASEQGTEPVLAPVNTEPKGPKGRKGKVQ